VYSYTRVLWYTWLTVSRVDLIHLADSRHVYSYTRGYCATCIKYTRKKRQPRVYYTCLTCGSVFYGTSGTVATCIHCTRGKLYNSQQPDLPHRAHVAIYTWQPVCHMYGLRTRGNLQVANCNFFSSASCPVIEKICQPNGQSKISQNSSSGTIISPIISTIKTKPLIKPQKKPPFSSSSTYPPPPKSHPHAHFHPRKTTSPHKPSL
jgi:hypothetical protein